MDFSVVSVVSNLPFRISCMDVWGEKLIFGTHELGVVVYDLRNQKYHTTPHDISDGLSIKQITAMQERILVLCGGLLKIFEIHFMNNLQLKLSWSLPFSQVDIYHFAYPILCVAIAREIHVYKVSLVSMSLDLVATFAIEAKAARMTVAYDRVIVATTPHQHYYSMHECYSFNMDKSHQKLLSAMCPVLLHCMEGGRLVVHTQSTSTIFERRAFVKRLLWTSIPSAIASTADYLIGISSRVVDVVSSEGSKQTMYLYSEEPLQFITSKEVFVASSRSVWHVHSKRLRSAIWENILQSLPLDPNEVQGNNAPEDPLDHRFSLPKSEEIDLPSNFSPESGLDVVGLSEQQQIKLGELGISTVEQFANLTSDASLLGIRENHKKAVEYMMEYLYKEAPKMKNVENSVGNVNPEDPLEVIGMKKEEIEYLAASMIFTVRQLAMVPKAEIASEGEVMIKFHEQAVEVINRHAKSPVSIQNFTKMHEGSILLTNQEYAYIAACHTIKSPYILFQEFMETSVDKRDAHPWSQVFKRYEEEVAISMGLQGSFSSPSNADVFSYLCWRYVSSFGALDATAGARAIFFRGQLTCVPRMEVNEVRINLTALCAQHGGKLYSQSAGYVWQPASLDEVALNRNACIVLPSGMIDADNFWMRDKWSNQN